MSGAGEEPTCSLVNPVFKSRPSVYSGRVVCCICFEGCLKKHSKRSNFQEIKSKETFKTLAEKWLAYDHEYNKVFSFIDWESKEILMAHKNCKGKFSKESFMASQPFIGIQESPPSGLSVDYKLELKENKKDEVEVSRKSSRLSCSYSSSKESKTCIICNEIKRSKGRIVPLVDMSFKNENEDKHAAEKSLIEFANLHVKHNNEKYIVSAQRIILTNNIKGLFEADVSYHKDCYQNFRSPCWIRKYSSKSDSDKFEMHEDEEEFFRLVRHHILDKQEIYTLAQLNNSYHELYKNRGAKIRSVDMKHKLINRFGQKITFIKGHGVNQSEFVAPESKRLMSDFLKTACRSQGIEDSITVKNIGKMIADSIICLNNEREKLWPPTPQDIMNSDLTQSSTLLYNLLAWIVSPNSSYGTDGIVKLSATKATKVTKLCTDIESLVPHSTPSLNQVLLSLNEYRKTGSSNIVTDLHRLGHGISYTDTTFIEDKWAEWSDSSSNLVPSNIKVGVIPTYVFDNIDWKNKDFRGNETHNTNCILIQPNNSNSALGVHLEANYDFDRKEHKSFKSEKAHIETSKFQRVQTCKRLPSQSDSETSIYENLTKNNVTWAVARYLASTMSSVDKIIVPSWTGFFKLLFEESEKASVGYLPPITSPPTEMSVIYAAIQRALLILNELRIEKMFMEVDQAIYAKVLDAMFKMDSEGSDIFSKVIPRMGGFHVTLCMLKTIYSRFKDSGLITWLVYSGCGGEGTIINALKGGDVNHGIHLHKLMYEAIMQSKLHYLIHIGKLQFGHEVKEMFSSFQEETEDPLLLFQRFKSEIPLLPILSVGMGCYLELYLEMVNLLLSTIFCFRTSDWNGYLECLRKFIPFCFAHNRHNYSRNLSYCYVHMKNLEENHPSLYSDILTNGFTVSLTGYSFTRIPCDQVIEMTVNRSSKSTGGLSGKTENVGASERWMKINHIMAALRDKLDGITRKRCHVSHVDYGRKRWETEQADIQSLMQTLEEWVPNLWRKDQAIINIATGSVASDEMVENVQSVQSRGTLAMESFLQKITLSEKETVGSYYDSIKKEKIISFSTKKKEKVVSQYEDENQSFAEILSRFEGKKLNLRAIMDWPVTSKPYAITAGDGKSRSSSKSLLRNYLQQQCTEKPTKDNPSEVETSIVDMMRVVRLIPINDAQPPTFLTWATRITSYLLGLPGSILHVVFDNYSPVDDYSQILSKGRENNGQERKISSLNQVLPKLTDWQDFLKNESNKFQVCNLLADHLTSDVSSNKTIYVTKEEECFIKRPNENRHLVPELYSCHREADHRIASHSLYAANSTDKPVCVIAEDTDVFILLLYLSTSINTKLYFRQGTRASKQGITYHNVTALARELGSDICKCLPAFHALTGSDYTKPFYRRSKIQSFKKLMKCPEKAKLLESLATTSVNMEEVVSFILHVIYNRPLREKLPGDSRYAMLFVKTGKKGKKNKKFASTKSLPPDQKSLEMKIKRANFVAYSWYECLDGNFKQPNPLLYGWRFEDNCLQPIWYEGKALPDEEDIKRSFMHEDEVYNNPETNFNNDSSTDEEPCNISEDEESFEEL